MKIETVIKMIDEYLEEKHTHKEWVEALQICREVLIEKINEGE
jgi:hypothetical protein